jgi:hypothetical protein|tara:strand:- start:164 stop:385 length:222 start_codon:yes stop_codon:yes gene_type:complete
MEFDLKGVLEITKKLGDISSQLDVELNKNMGKLKKNASDEELKEAAELFEKFDVNEKAGKMKQDLEELRKKFA